MYEYVITFPKITIKVSRGVRSCSIHRNPVNHYVFYGVVWTHYFMLAPQETLEWRGTDSRRSRRGSAWSLFYSVRTAVVRSTGQLPPAMITSHEENETRITWHSPPPWKCAGQDVLKNCLGSTFVAYFSSLQLAGILRISYITTFDSKKPRILSTESIYGLGRILRTSSNYFSTQH